MWTNPVTSPRALPSSSVATGECGGVPGPPRRRDQEVWPERRAGVVGRCVRWRARRRAILTAIALFFLLAPLDLAAQEGGEGRAILLEGPTSIRGVPGIGPNAYTAQRAVYELASETEIELFLLALLVEEPLSWAPFSCAPLSAGSTTQRTVGTAVLYAYQNEGEGRTLILRGPVEASVSCAFLASFLEELSFFSSALRERSPLLPFPAVLSY